MANNNQISNESKINFPSSFTRLNGQPLDHTAVWNNLQEAQEYAASGQAYVGQLLSVVTNMGTADAPKYISRVYVVYNEAGDLVEVGVGGYSIQVVDGYPSDAQDNVIYIVK